MKKDHNSNWVTWPFQGRAIKRGVLLASLFVAFIFVLTAMLIGSQAITAEEEPSGCSKELIKKLCTECSELMAELGVDCSKILTHLKCFPEVPENHWRGEYYYSGMVLIRDHGKVNLCSVYFDVDQVIQAGSSGCYGGRVSRVVLTKTVVSKGGRWNFRITKPVGSHYSHVSRFKITVDGVTHHDKTTRYYSSNDSVDLPKGRHTIQVEYWPRSVPTRGTFRIALTGPEELPPAAPSSLTTAYFPETARAQLTWTDNSVNEANFELERRSGTYEWRTLATSGPDRTSFNDEDSIEPDTIFEYRIKATNIAGSSAYSNTATVTTGLPPAAPSGLKATFMSSGEDDDYIELTWTNNSENEVWFELETLYARSDWTDLKVLPRNKTICQLFDVGEETNQKYRVRAKNDWGTSEWSNFAPVTIPEITEMPVEPEQAPVVLSVEILESGSPVTGYKTVKSNYSGKQGRAVQYSNSKNLALGSKALPAVASTTIAGYADIHKPEFVNDGYYGNGSSWIGSAANSWIKIDLGDKMLFNRIQFGRDRTENGYSDRSPSHFIIYVADSDSGYANGNAANDSSEYRMIFDSTEHEFNQRIQSPQSVLVSFPTVTAQFIKLQFTTSDAAIDEVEVW